MCREKNEHVQGEEREERKCARRKKMCKKKENVQEERKCVGEE